VSYSFKYFSTTFGKNIGFEQNGSGDNFSRPVLIVKKFNNHMFWCVPLSTKQKTFDFYFNYTDQKRIKSFSHFGSVKTYQYQEIGKKNLRYAE